MSYKGTLGYRKIEIIVGDPGEGNYGIWSPTRGTIVLDKCLFDDPQQALDVLIHEFAHAYSDVYDEDWSERDVVKLATAFAQFLFPLVTIDRELL